MNDELSEADIRSEKIEEWQKLLAGGVGYADAYGIMTGRAEWGGKLKWFPENMHGGIARWVLFGIVPGDFLQAVIRGDLFEAAARADDINQGLLFDYCKFLYNCVPGDCYGSPEAFAVHQAKGGMF